MKIKIVASLLLFINQVHATDYYAIIRSWRRYFLRVICIIRKHHCNWYLHWPLHEEKILNDELKIVHTKKIR